MTQPQKDEIVSNLYELDGDEFEKVVAKVWKKQGYNTEIKGGTGDKGIDIEATKQDAFDKRRHLIQAKAYSKNNKVGSEEIQRYSGLYNRPEQVDNVYVVTTSKFTSGAKEVANNRDVSLINGGDIAKNIAELGLEKIILDRNTSTNTGRTNSFSSTKSRTNREKKNSISTKNPHPSKEHPFSTRRLPDNASPVPNQNLVDNCPECKKLDTIWFTKDEDGKRFLKCESCNAGWKEKKGLLFKSWEQYKGSNKGKTKRKISNW